MSSSVDYRWYFWQGALIGLLVGGFCAAWIAGATIGAMKDHGLVCSMPSPPRTLNADLTGAQK